MNNISDIISSRIKEIENTYSIIYNESIDDKEQFITKDFVRDTIANKKFFNGGRPIEKDDFRYEAFQDLEENVDIVYSVLSRLEFLLTVFRGLSVSPEKEIRLGGNIGEHWTTNWNIFYRKGEYGFNEPNVRYKKYIKLCKLV